MKKPAKPKTPKPKTLKVLTGHLTKCGRKTEERTGEAKLCELASSVCEFEPGTFGTLCYGD